MTATTASELQALKRVPYAQLDAWHLLALRRRLEWLEQARPDQLPPADGWALWLYIAGRGTGKTRTAAEHSWFRASWARRTRWLVSAPTTSDIRDTCFEGESGIVALLPAELIRKYNRSLAELELKNGSLLKGIPLFEPDRMRGPQWHGAWVDELAAAEKNKVEDAWKNLTLAVRLPGLRTEKVVTTTPKPIPLMMELVKQADKAQAQAQGKSATVPSPSAEPSPSSSVIITRAATYDNLENLEPSFKDEVLKHEGTKYGQQEIYGILLNPEEAGIIRRSWFKLWKYLDARGKQRRLPKFKLIVQSYDTAFGQKQTEAEDNTACVVFGVFDVNDPANALTAPTNPSVARSTARRDPSYAVMVADAWQDKIGYPDLRKRVTDEFAKGRYGEADDGLRPTVLLIEQKSSGISLIQDLNDQSVPALGYNPGRLDKFQRLNLVSYLPFNGLVWFPESTKPELVGKPRSWADELITTLCLFPQVRHDDYVDAFGQGLQYLADQGWLKVKNPHIVLPEDRDYHAERRARVNPYAR